MSKWIELYFNYKRTKRGSVLLKSVMFYSDSQVIDKEYSKYEYLPCTFVETTEGSYTTFHTYEEFKKLTMEASK